MIVSFMDGKSVGIGNRPYFVAEINSSHNGSVETAKKMIDAAYLSGCDCVKFQSFTPESLYSKSYYIDNPIARRFVTRFSFDNSKLRECAEYCKRKSISFTSTPYSEKEVDFLAELGVPFIKIASMEITNLPFLKYIAVKGLPIVLSTGMATVEEIAAAVKTIEQAGNKSIVLLHCVSIYPVAVKDANLLNITWLHQNYTYPVGYSDHTIGFEAASAAVALGASLIEKHLTLDHTQIGMDNQMATEPDDMALVVQSCCKVYSARGSTTREISLDEWEQRKKMRRSLVYTRDMKKGAVLCAGDIDAKRPGTGIDPSKKYEIIGKRLINDVGCDILIREEDFE